MSQAKLLTTKMYEHLAEFQTPTISQLYEETVLCCFSVTFLFLPCDIPESYEYFVCAYCQDVDGHPGCPMAACWSRVIQRGTVALNVGEHWDSWSVPRNRCPPSPGIGLPLTHLLWELWLEQVIQIVIRVKDNYKHCVSREALRFEKSHLPLFFSPTFLPDTSVS